jgi:hypothetical protein
MKKLKLDVGTLEVETPPTGSSEGAGRRRSSWSGLNHRFSSVSTISAPRSAAPRLAST